MPTQSRTSENTQSDQSPTINGWSWSSNSNYFLASQSWDGDTSYVESGYVRIWDWGFNIPEGVRIDDIFINNNVMGHCSPFDPLNPYGDTELCDYRIRLYFKGDGCSSYTYIGGTYIEYPSNTNRTWMRNWGDYCTIDEINCECWGIAISVEGKLTDSSHANHVYFCRSSKLKVNVVYTETGVETWDLHDFNSNGHSICSGVCEIIADDIDAKGIVWCEYPDVPYRSSYMGRDCDTTGNQGNQEYGATNLSCDNDFYGELDVTKCYRIRAFICDSGNDTWYGTLRDAWTCGPRADTVDLYAPTTSSLWSGVCNVDEGSPSTIDKRGVVLCRNDGSDPPTPNCYEWKVEESTTSTSDWETEITGLPAGTEFQVRGYVCRSGYQYGFGDVQIGSTTSTAISITTCEPDQAYYTYFRGGGKDITGTITRKGFYVADYDKDPINYPIGCVYVDTSDISNFHYYFTQVHGNIVPGGHYNVRAFACNYGISVGWGAIEDVTLSEITAETCDATNIGETTVTVGVRDITTACGAIDKKGVVFCLYPFTPSLTNNIKHEYEDTSSTANKSWNSTGLGFATQYNIRAYACMSGGDHDIDYGDTCTFTTNPLPFEVTTRIPDQRWFTSIRGGGIDISGGGSSTLDEKGVLFKEGETTPTYTDYDFRNCIEDGDLTDYHITTAFLSPETVYSIRAYICDNSIVAYGNTGLYISGGICADTVDPFSVEMTKACAGVENIGTNVYLPDSAISDKGVLLCLNDGSNAPTLEPGGYADIEHHATNNRDDECWQFTGLTPETSYQVRSYVCKDGIMIDYGDTCTFTTLAATFTIYTGWGMCRNVGGNFEKYQVCGHGSYPPLCNASNNWGQYTGADTDYGIYISDDAFTLTSAFQAGHEAVMTMIHYEGWEGWHANIQWCNPDGDLIQEKTIETISDDTWEFDYLGIYPGKIDMNGTYTINAFAIQAGCTPSMGTKTFTVSNVPTITQLTSDKRGYIWVTGDYLAFVDANCVVHCICGGNQGGYIDTSKAGTIWVEESEGYLSCSLQYITESGYHYKTLNGDCNGWEGWNNMPEWTYSDCKGFTWVETECNKHNLFFINSQGKKFRLSNGAGPLGSDEY